MIITLENIFISFTQMCYEAVWPFRGTLWSGEVG